MKRKTYIFGALLTLLVLTACQGGKTTAGEAEEGDTLKMKYAKLLTIVKHGESEDASGNGEGADYQYDEAIVANPWKAGTLLHRYIQIPKGEEGDKTVAMLAYSLHNGSFSQPCGNPMACKSILGYSANNLNRELFKSMQGVIVCSKYNKVHS